jgi:hypothetical protein
MKKCFLKALGYLRTVRVEARHADKLLLSCLPDTCGRQSLKLRPYTGPDPHIETCPWFNLQCYRIDWGPGYRLYITQDGVQLIILIVGGTKKRQERASALLDEYRGREAKAKS